jgi:hypothetical protein
VNPRFGGAKTRRWLLVASLVLCAVGASCWWYREQLWTIDRGPGHNRCRVRSGWVESQVVQHCGPADGRGEQIKVFMSEGWKPLARACSAPGDVFGAKAVLYDCDGRVYVVERMPVGEFVYPNP